MLQDAFARDGCRLGWRRDGRRGSPALLLCNSIGTDHRLWEPQMAALVRHFEVIRFDMRGHGASSAPTGDYRLATLAGDAVAVLDAAEVGRAHVCGLSLGGALAQRLTLDAPQRVDRLVLANTAARIGTAEAWQQRMDVVLEQGLDAIADMAMARFFDEGFRRSDPEVVDGFRAALVAGSAHGYAGCCAALRDADMSAEASSITAPTLVIAGSLDVSTPPGPMRALADAIPDARYEELVAAHLSNVEKPEAFARLLAEFLSDDR